MSHAAALADRQFALALRAQRILAELKDDADQVDFEALAYFLDATYVMITEAIDRASEEHKNQTRLPLVG